MLDLLLFPIFLRALLPLPASLAPVQTHPVAAQQTPTPPKPELLTWSASRPLTWADFKGRPNTADPLHALTTASIGAQIGCQDYVFSANVQATFTPSESWVKAPHTESVALLHHEQVHFDLTEVHARMLRQKLRTLKFDCEHLQPSFNNVMKVAIANWQREQQRYDVDTNHGLNLVKQKTWDDQVLRRLGELQAFAAPAAPHFDGCGYLIRPVKRLAAYLAAMSTPAELISWADFERVDLRVGTIVDAQPFPEARKPAFRLLIDLGPEIGLKKSSAQITALYTPETLVGRQVLCVVNFPPKQVGPLRSEVLVTGATDAEGRIVLATFAGPVPNGSRLI